MISNQMSDQQSVIITKASLEPLPSPPSLASFSSKVTNTPLMSLERKSKFAYATLISGIDSSGKYRGFLLNTLIMKSVLAKSGSTADVIAFLGFQNEGNNSYFDEDLQMLFHAGVRTLFLPRWTHSSERLSFAEMALLKITPYSLVEYEKIQFFDGDVMPLRNMDCFFELSRNSFTVGAASPLNSGWFLAKPNQTAFEYMKSKAVWRLARDWDKINGWKEPMTKGLFYRGERKSCDLWDFNGADMDQGLFTHYFILNYGDAILIDTEIRRVKILEKGLLSYSTLGQSYPVKSTQETLSCCGGKDPTQFFAHFTGRNKPWMKDLSQLPRKKSNNIFLRWAEELDSLNLPITSKNIHEMGFGSPLGYFNANFPKGGFKVSS